MCCLCVVSSFVGCRRLFAVCCMMFVTSRVICVVRCCWLLCVASTLFFVGWCLLCVGCWLLFAVCCLLLIVWCSLLVARCLLSVVQELPFDA